LNATLIYPKLPRMAGAAALSLALLAVAVVAPVSDQEMRVATDRLRAEVGAVRRIPPRGVLERRLVTRAEAEAARDEGMAAQALDVGLAGRARLWARLGLLPAGVDVARLVARGLDAAPTASYDAASHRLTVPDWLPLADQRVALAHAVAHALADERFGLRQFLGFGLDGRHGLDGDAERARLALVEGDASVAALELVDARGAFAGGHALVDLAAKLRAAPADAGAASTPAWIRANAAFTYGDGLLFVGRVRARESWAAVDALWADPPQSSEQVLHPEKYDARDRPVSVTVPKLNAAGTAFHEAGSDVLGELGVRTWLEAAVPAEIAARAAAGWGGDRAVLYESAAASAPAPTHARDGGATPADAASTPDAGATLDVGPAPVSFVAWSTVWDDATDAEDFARTAVLALAHLAGVDEAPSLDAHGRAVVQGADGVFALAWRGRAVALLLAAPDDVLPALDELLASLKEPPRLRAPVRKAKGP
jgi:hypothetical protein